MAASRKLWVVVGGIYGALALSCGAILLAEPVPTLRIQVLGAMLAVAAIAHLATRPPSIESRMNHVAVACSYVVSACGLFAAQPGGSLAIGGAMFVAPFVASRLVDRRLIALHIVAANALLIGVAVSGIGFGLVDESTQIACLLVMAGSCVQCFTCAVMLEAAEKQGAELELLTRSDVLTGIGNRRQFEQRLEQRVAGYVDPSDAFGVVIVDLNDFKSVNDKAGHLAGDEVLKIVAARLRSIVTPEETLVRLGGDEFCLILDERDAGHERSEARVRRALTSISYNDFTITAGVGGASCPADSTDPEALQLLADARLREDKHRPERRQAAIPDRRKPHAADPSRPPKRRD